MEFKKDVRSVVSNTGYTLDLPRELLKMLIPGPNPITPTPLEVTPQHGLNLKTSQVIAMCSYGRNPLSKARK